MAVPTRQSPGIHPPPRRAFVVLAFSKVILASASVAIALGAVAHPCWAQPISVSRQHDAWGRFAAGCWVQVRKLTQEFDERGMVRSVSTTDTKTTLLDAQSDGYDLRVEVTVETAGKRFPAQPRSVHVGYYGQAAADHVELRTTGSETLEIGGASIACTVMEATLDGTDQKVVSRLLHNESLWPFVMQRETLSTDPTGKQIRWQTNVETLAVEMPYRVLDQTKTSACLRTIERHAQGTRHTLEFVCPDVPGGLVAHWSKELDESGGLTRRSTLELLDYDVVEEPRAVRHVPVYRHRFRRTAPRSTR